MEAEYAPMLDKYRCGECGATECKLWREYQTFVPKILCALCAAANQDKDISDIDAEGLRTNEHFPGRRTDTIGWYVPAIPTLDGSAYWGYTSVPPDACRWWEKLPTLPETGSS